MIYLVEIEGRDDLRVELSEDKRGVFTAHVGDQQSVDLELRGRGEDGAYLFAIDGEVRSFHLDTNCTNYLLDDGDTVSRFQVDRAGEVVLNHDQLHDTDWDVPVDTLASNITGIVLEVLVAAGEQVERGDPVVVVEAMKMENTLTAPMTGTVVDVRVDTGQTVYAGDKMVGFE